jgi:hypothetical protein
MARSAKTDIANQFYLAHKDLPLRQMARMMYEEHQMAFKDIEDARSSLRYQAGTMGEKNRKAIPEENKRSPEVGAAFRNNPFGFTKTEADGWRPKPLEITKGRGLVLADQHLPYQDNRAHTIAINWAKENQYTDFILIDGDLNDFYQFSRFDRDPDKRDFMFEMECTKKYLEILQKQFPNAKIIIKHGNHDYHFERFINQKAPELNKLTKWVYKTYLDLHAKGITLIDHDVPITVGKLNILHGHEIHIYSNVNAARGAYLKTHECVMVAHLHKTSQHTETSIRGRQDSAWGIGCMCDLHPAYARVNNWNHGFVGLEVDGSDFQVENKRIIQGEVAR